MKCFFSKITLLILMSTMAILVSCHFPDKSDDAQESVQKATLYPSSAGIENNSEFTYYAFVTSENACNLDECYFYVNGEHLTIIDTKKISIEQARQELPDVEIPDNAVCMTCTVSASIDSKQCDLKGTVRFCRNASDAGIVSSADYSVIK